MSDQPNTNSSSLGSMSSLGSNPLGISIRKSNERAPGPDGTGSDEEMNDPDTDNEQHARKLLLRSRARNGSITSESGYTSSGIRSPIAVLPPEILCVIFSYLNSKSDLISVALTCRYWANLIIELIWFRPGISSRVIFERLGKVMAIPRTQTAWDYRKYIKRLNLSLVPHLVTNEYLSLFSGANHLERITLVNCSNISHEHISEIIRGCHRLQSIDLTGVKGIQDDIYYELANNCKRLQGLYAPGSFQVSKTAVLALINSCPLLKRVKLSDCNNVDDEVVNQLVTHCPNLVEIDLHGCEKVTNKSLHNLFSRLEFLKEFKISKNANITYECFESKTGAQLCLDKMRILDFTQCLNITDRAVEKVIKLAPKLRNVVLSKCTAITDASLRAIATLGKNLHYVHLGHCSNITDFGAKDLIKSCYRLQYIDLACCTQLTNETVYELSQLPRLRRIGLVKCAQITDEGILALANNARNSDDTLERVHLSYCMNLTIYPIYRLLKACPKLTHISLTGVSQFLRPDITQFCREPPQEFNLHQKSIFCVFSGEGVAQLRNHLLQLFETPQDPEREAAELLDIIAAVIEGVDDVNSALFSADPIQRERLRVFVDTLDRFINEFHGLNVPRTHLELFGRCVFTRLPAEHVPRIQRFFQLLQNHPHHPQRVRQANTGLRGRPEPRQQLRPPETELFQTIDDDEVMEDL
ncbi:hypothetical protein KL938_002887 [Ogataea parapolymorpha]|nr:hypothetical protein KL938_002887 [Ogataea parapolymorpha]